MDREEALKLLRGGQEGVNEWNRRREDGEDIPKLSNADLTRAHLTGADLRGADLRDASLGDANLRSTNLRDANLTYAILTGVNIRGANLRDTDLTGADLRGADLRSTNLTYANLTDANLRGADLRYANLPGVNLTDADFGQAKVSGALFGRTTVACDLSGTLGLNEAVHLSPSPVAVNECLLEFKDNLPEKFLRGCGLEDAEIEYFRARVGNPIRHYSCFISYSTVDEEFAKRLHNDFQGAGIRCWKWTKDARTGKSMWGEIDGAIRNFNKLVLIASRSAMQSPYVMDEIERAIQKEREIISRQNKAGVKGDADVLFPVRIDDYILDEWEHERKADVVRKVIADARCWDSDAAKYNEVRDRLIRDLKA